MIGTAQIIVTACAALMVGAGAALSMVVPTRAIDDAPIAVKPALSAGGEPLPVAVARGANAGGIAQELEKRGVIADAGVFRTIAGLMGVQSDLAAGQYELSRGAPTADLVQRLRRGITVPSVTVTLPEGWRVEQMATLIERRGLASAADFLAATRQQYDYAALRDRPDGASLEGYLFPDTYFFSAKATPREIVERLLTTFDERFSAEVRAAAQQQKLTPHQAVTLASIVEREAQVAEERPIIAAVFINRLRLGMPLQADPTVQFAIADAASVEKYGWWKRDLTVEDLKANSPYNSYTTSGLPPGPIANPGLASLRAVAFPAPVKHLYFVARGDGSHAFADTLDEHNRNVQRFQR